MFNKSKLSVIVALSLSPVSLTTMAEQPSYDMGQRMFEAQNTCIVRFDDSISKFDVEGVARGMLASANAKAKHIYSHSIKGFAVNMPCPQAENAFGNNASIASFEQDRLVFAVAPPPGKGKNQDGDTSEPPASQSTPWGISRVGGPFDGSGLTAWVIDTGIDLNHPDLMVDSSRGFSAFSNGPDASPDDKHGHGTHVAGTIAAINNDIDVVGVAAGATVIPVKVLDRRGSGTTSGVIAGIDFVAANGAAGDCANMSLGGGKSASLDAAVQSLAATGVMVSLAAGNESQFAGNVSPAGANGATIYTISATDVNDNFAYFSNYGNPPVDYAAPGVAILSLKVGGGTTTASGTSMAAPHACGVLLSGSHTSSGTAKGDPDASPDPIIHL